MPHRLPLFPLPAVLFPGVPLPLHVFEPRYRQMMAHCLERDKRFGLIYHDPDRSGPFEVSAGQVGCVAEISKFQPLADGHSLVLVEGRERFLVADEIQSGSMYYEGLVDEYDDLPEDEREIARRARQTQELFKEALEHNIQDLEALPPVDGEETISFQIAQWIKIDPTWQQRLLELRSEGERLDVLDDLLRSSLESETEEG